MHDLFELLKTAPTKSVRPSNELAVLTLDVSDALEGNPRKESIVSPNGPPALSAISYDKLPIYGPEGPPLAASQSSTTPIDEDTEMVDLPTDKRVSNGSDTSEATLVELEALPPYKEKDTNASDETVDIIIKQDDDGVLVDVGNPAPETAKLSPPDNPPPIPPRNKSGLKIQTDTDKSESSLLTFGAQQDVTEVIFNVTWRLQCAIKPTSIDAGGEQTDTIRDTFFGETVTYTQKAQNTERKLEAWQNISGFPHLTKPCDIYEALDVNFDQQAVLIGSTKKPQYQAITRLPPILQIHIQRAVYDNVNKIGFKNRNLVKLPETLYMDRYMDSNDPNLLKRRQEAWKWKSQLKALEARQAILQQTEAKITVPDALLDTKNFVTILQEVEIPDLEIDDTLPETIEERVAEVAAELESLAVEIAALKQKLAEQFTDLTKHEYKLQTVFIHRGESTGGHYWIYLYDFENDIWREYNDDHVSIIKDRNRIFNPDASSGGGTPYCVMYVRNEDKQDLVDAVVREVKEVEMPDIVDEGIGMVDEEIRHVDYGKPRAIAPMPLSSTEGWEDGKLNPHGVDANGRPW